MRKQAPILADIFQYGETRKINSPEWLQWFQELSDYYDRILKWIDPYNANFGKAAPASAYLVDGLLVYANGTDWDPGSGKGYYRYNSTGGGSWEFVG